MCAGYKALSEKVDALLARSSTGLTDRAKLIHEHDCPKVWDFFKKYALGSKLCPSCLLCGQQRFDRKEEWAITHAELPDIYICKVCVDAVRSASRESSK